MPEPIEALERVAECLQERTKSVVFPACCVAAQRQVYTIVTVLDLKGLKMAAFTKDVRAFVAAISKIDQVRDIPLAASYLRRGAELVLALALPCAAA